VRAFGTTRLSKSQLSEMAKDLDEASPRSSIRPLNAVGNSCSTAVRSSGQHGEGESLRRQSTIVTAA